MTINEIALLLDKHPNEVLHALLNTDGFVERAKADVSRVGDVLDQFGPIVAKQFYGEIQEAPVETGASVMDSIVNLLVIQGVTNATPKSVEKAITSDSILRAEWEQLNTDAERAAWAGKNIPMILIAHTMYCT